MVVDLARLRTRLPASPLTRFAPAPTGYLHLGHVANAVFVWGVARALGGRVLLRIEDHDRQRCRPLFEQALLDDLDWLGFLPDVHFTDSLRSGPSEGRQSGREAVYREAADALARAGRLYGCACTRREIQSDAVHAHDDGRPSAATAAPIERPYSGRCRTRGLALTDDVGWRLRIDAGEEPFDDARLGPQVQVPADQCGDLLIRDRLGNWTYQFAVSVDDTRQGVDLVIRGMDLLDSTGRQLRLARLLDRTQPPVYLHHPLLMKSATQKLSKSDGDTGVRELRAAGHTASQLIGQAAWRAGLQPDDRPIAAAAVADLFAGA